MGKGTGILEWLRSDEVWRFATATVLLMLALLWAAGKSVADSHANEIATLKREIKTLRETVEELRVRYEWVRGEKP